MEPPNTPRLPHKCGPTIFFCRGRSEGQVTVVSFIPAVFVLGQACAPSVSVDGPTHRSVNDRITDTLHTQDAGEVIELQLDNCNSGGTIADMKISEKFSRLKSLHLCNSNIRKLDGFPALPSLRRLELADNRLEGGLENLQSLPSLKTLNLAGNRIKDLKTLEPLKELEELTTLDLLENPICTADSGYPDAIFDLLPQLVYLDETDREGNPMLEDDDEDEDDDDDDDDLEDSRDDGEVDEYEDDDVDEIEDEDEGDASTLLDDGDAQGEALFDDADDVDDDDDDESDESDDGNSDSEGAGQKRAHDEDGPDDEDDDNEGGAKRQKSDDEEDDDFVDDDLDAIVEPPL